MAPNTTFTTRHKYIGIVAAIMSLFLIIHLVSPTISTASVSKWSIPSIPAYFKPSSGSGNGRGGLAKSHKNSTKSTATTLAELVDPKKATGGGMNLDVVISVFQESLDETVEALADVRAVASRLHLKYDHVRVFVYVKDENADPIAIKEALQTDLVYVIPNRGRESGTFLNHIVKNWDSLAYHTMFIQAHMHHRPAALNKMSDYLIPSTGYLNLGIFEICNCITCTDPWDGSREFSRIPELYSMLNNKLCPQHIALSYLAQFIVSRKRVYNTPRSAYEYILSVVESDMTHFIHTDPRQGQFDDSISNPYFGHTVERSYPMLFGCENATLAIECGTGFGAMDVRRSPGDADAKCQCLDV